MSPTDAWIVHRTPGRLRLKVPSKKGDACYFGSLQECFSSLPGIIRTEANPATASLLLLVEPGREIPIEDSARGLFKLRGDEPRETLQERTVKRISEINDEVRRFTAGELDLRTVAFVGFLGLGIYQLGIGNITAPAWYVALWYAMNIPVSSAK